MMRMQASGVLGIPEYYGKRAVYSYSPLPVSRRDCQAEPSQPHFCPAFLSFR